MSDDSSTSYFRHPLKRGRVVSDRDAALCRLASGKRVVHIGCVDWPITADRLEDGSLLHGKLLACAEDLIGVDIDEEGLDRLASTLGGSYRAFDFSDSPEPDDALVRFDPNLILLGDVIEHVPRPEALLSGIAALARATGARVAVTTPNALAFRSVLNTAIGYEMMHQDHVCVHTATTLGTLLSRCGLDVDQWVYYTIRTGNDLPHRAYDSVSRIPALIRSSWGDGLIALCTAR